MTVGGDAPYEPNALVGWPCVFSLCDLSVSLYPLRLNSFGCGSAALGDSLASLPFHTLKLLAA